MEESRSSFLGLELAAKTAFAELHFTDCISFHDSVSRRNLGARRSSVHEEKYPAREQLASRKLSCFL